jgi:Holliday junction resolvasome RuvABC endonuclease subunit
VSADQQSLVIVCLDLANDAGWAVFDLDGKLIASGTWRVGRRPKSHPGERWSEFRFELAALLEVYRGRVVCVAYERPIIYGGPRSYNTARIIFAQAAIADSVALLYGIDLVIEVQPKAMKKLLTGNGNASKALMSTKAEEKWGALAQDDDGTEIAVKLRGDEADARAVGNYVLTNHEDDIKLEVANLLF